MKILSGHTTQETAYLVEDYPYGFTLRCKIRFWLEFKKGHGYRLVSQTTNPKKSSQFHEIWNKAKASTYMPIGVMFLDDDNHVQWTGIGVWAGAEKLQEFLDKYGEGLDDEAKGFIERAIRIAKGLKEVGFK